MESDDPDEITSITARKIGELRACSDPALRKMVLVKNILLRTGDGGGDTASLHNSKIIEDFGSLSDLRTVWEDDSHERCRHDKLAVEDCVPDGKLVQEQAGLPPFKVLPVCTTPMRNLLQIKLMIERSSSIRSMEEEKFRKRVKVLRGIYTSPSLEELFQPPPQSYIEGFLSAVPSNHGGDGDHPTDNQSLSCLSL